MDIPKAIKSNYLKCKESPENLKAELLFSIIQLKAEDNNNQNIEQTLYVDIKSFILTYISSIEKRDYGYDKLNIKKIIKAINCCIDSKERFELFLFLNRLLIKQGLIDESKSVQIQLNSVKTQMIKDHSSGLNKWMKLLLHFTSYNLYAILFTLILVYLVSSILFLPTDNPKHVIFSINYDHYSTNFALNHFLNTLGGVFGIKKDYEVIPLNTYGILLFITFKFFYIVFIINYLYKKGLEIVQL